MSDTLRFLLYLFVMAGVTYLIRVLPLLFVRKKIRSRFLRSLLYYSPYAVLSAMTFPAVFSVTEHPVSAILAVAAAIVLAFCKKKLVVVAACAVGVAILFETLFYFLA